MRVCFQDPEWIVEDGTDPKGEKTRCEQSPVLVRSMSVDPRPK